MARTGDTLDMGPLGATFHVTKTAAETEGQSFEMEWELAPRSGGTPVHVHPEAVERYEVLEGSLDLYVDGTWTTLTKGEHAEVPRNVPHTFRNGSDEVTRVHNTHAPAQRFGAYFEGLAALVAEGVIASPKPSPKAMLHLAVHITKFPDEIRIVKPPHAVIRLMAGVGRALGYGRR